MDRSGLHETTGTCRTTRHECKIPVPGVFSLGRFGRNATGLAGRGSPRQIPAPTPPAAAAPGAGWLNEALRNFSPAFKEWDIGGQFRFRYEMTDGAGSYPNRDFIRHGVDNDNAYFLFREKLHIGWNPEPWLKLYVEGRGAQAESDTRDPSPGQDVFDLF